MTKGALYGIFIGLCLLGYMVTSFIAEDSTPADGQNASSEVTRADEEK